jgi:hypothetical protein
MRRSIVGYVWRVLVGGGKVDKRMVEFWETRERSNKSERHFFFLEAN